MNQIPVRTGKTCNRFARAIEAKLKEKNTMSEYLLGAITFLDYYMTAIYAIIT